MLIKKDDDKTTFTDPTTGKTASFSKYYPKYIGAAGNDNFLVAINGADGKVYYTVLDKNANMLFEPVAGTGANANDGRLVLCTDGRYSAFEYTSKCSVLDYTGKVIIPAGTYSYIGAFNSGIAWAKNSSDQYVGIDVNGKVVIS